MANAVVMPKLGNSVESSIILSWKVQPGDVISEGDVLCEVETDKATLEVESSHSGTVLALFFGVGDDVPVMTSIAAVGEPGEDYEALRPASGEPEPAPATPAPEAAAPVAASTPAPAATNGTAPSGHVGVSPRARNLAERKAIDVTALMGSGPGGRIIERDILAAIESQPKMTPLAESMLRKGEFVVPERGTGPGGRISARDLQPAAASGAAAAPVGETTVIPLKGMRKVIASRMLESLQTTAQLTLNAYADARALLAYRKRLKASPEALGLNKVTINDLILFAVTRTLMQYPDLNATFDGEAITQYGAVNLGFAVDTPRGLLVPVVHNAHGLSLKALSAESGRLAEAGLGGSIQPDEMNGGTFTVTNLGSLGIDTFTPVLNPPQVAILGVGGVSPRPVMDGDDVAFIPHIALSLTINHQVVDGAPAARFLQSLSTYLAQLDLVLAL